MLVLLLSLLWAPGALSAPAVPVGIASPADVVVNRYATVQSADGYVNLRVTPATDYPPERQLENGTRVLVLTCDSAQRGRRWCHVRADTPWSGYVYDAELDYAPPEPVRPAHEGGGGRRPGHGTVAGAGIASGFRTVGDEAVVRSDDGYLNLRAGPSSSRDALHRLPNDSLLWVYGCRSGAKGARWCFVEEVNETLFGYVYDRELAYFEHEDHEH